MKTNEEVLIARAHELALSCLNQDVKVHQVGWILSHLQQHRNVAATLELLRKLPESCFKDRSKKTKGQLRALSGGFVPALAGQQDWRRMARLVGWTRRWMVALGAGE